jgi:uncharacterized protein (TIGR03435 family)
LRVGKAHVGTKIDAARVDIGTAPLFRLICIAYRLKQYQVIGPDWLKTRMFDIQAKIPDGVTTEKVPEMLRTLLVERFGLKIHHDSKEQSVYALMVAKGGPKLKESAPAPPTAADAPSPEKASTETFFMPTVQGDVKLTRGAQGISIEMPGGEISGKLRASIGGAGAASRIHIESSRTTMKTFAELLSVGVVDRPVVDMTGLTGQYDLTVELSLEDAMKVARASVYLLPVGGKGGGGDAERARAEPGGGASDPSGASIFASIKNLGLKLEARKAPLDLLVVDYMDKTPTEN